MPIRFKPARFFRVSRSLYRFERWFRAGTLFLPPAGPGLPPWAAGTGEDPGEIIVYANGDPAYLGDGPLAGDGAGSLTGYSVVIAGGAPTIYTTARPFTIVSGGHAEGATVNIAVTPLGHEGRPGTTLVLTATAAVTPPIAYLGLVDPGTGFGIMSGGQGWAIPEPA